MNEITLYNSIIYLLFTFAIITFFSLLFIPAPYGRYTRKGWGPQINAKAAWIIQELPSVAVFAYFFFIGEYFMKISALILFSLWQIHYVHRTFIYPLGTRGGKKATLVTVSLAFLFTSLNGYINARWLSHFSGGYEISWLYDLRFISGVLLFTVGFIINRHSDRILMNLRKPGETDYKIPRGGFFKYVSCANYFGEIMEWFGFAIASWSLPGLCFAVFTFANLAPRAITHHKWYKEKFSDYPSSRKAVIPFIL